MALASRVAGLQPLPKPAGRPLVDRRVGDRSILDEITIDYGPPELLGRLFLKAEAQAREAGVRLRFATFDELVEANEANKKHWHDLVATLDIRRNALTPDKSFCILGYDARGRVVATQAARLFTWTNSTFKEEAESLRLFYDDPSKWAMKGECCEVTAPSASQIRGRCAFSGGVWYHPDFRSRGLSSCVTRISRALCFTRWYTDVIFSLMLEKVVKRGFAEQVGYKHVEFDVNLRNTRLGTTNSALIWMREQELFEDIAGYLGLGDPQVDAVVHDRAAQQ